MSQTVLLMGATLSPALWLMLQTVVTHRDEVGRIVADVVAEMERFAVLAPSLALAAEVVRMADARRRLMG